MRLSEKMEERHHTKLVMKKRVTMQKEANLNPNAVLKPVLSKRKVMRATTTRLINKIWGDYYSIYFPEDSKDSEAHDSKEVEEQEDTEEEEADDESISVDEEKASTSYSLVHSGKFKPASKETKWEGEPTGKMDSGEALYKCALVHGHWVAVGRAAIVEANELSEVPAILFLEYMFEKHDGTKMLHGRVMLKGSETILGNAADEREVFLTNNCMEIELGYIRELVSVEIQSRQWGHKYRKEHANADKIDRGKAEERKKKGLPVEFYCKSLYWPERGGFFTLPYKSLGLGIGVCNSCEQKVSQQDEFLISSKTCFIYKKSEYNVHDFLYIRPQFLAEENEEDHGTHKAGRNVGLKAFVVCHLLEIQTSLGCKDPTPKSTQVRVRRFYRPEDVSTTKAYGSDIREVSASLTKWAIEYEQPAGEAFSVNHPEALVFIDNCNVILRCGDADDCNSTPEAAELAATFDEEKIKNLPVPGEVDFINGGPPCQVRFGILEAGAYGVSQSRKRALIWAASPEETLPEWPEPMHVFAGSELRISMPSGVHYAAVKSTAGGAPFRSITVHPQPMGKVGMCFHPEQDRILTVRECARSQGFTDSYRFSGSVQNKHRQIGNAVPPPLAYALGRKLKEAVESKRR
ncbi:hypothetical protein B296_00030319 [Ensete ventricosum]|uniref:DNA (cytosine-5-)-methyltransferase n=1 Tax=Ensete ventricosum TaxID=4639 RepID=A0A426ZBN9_ENSVE|nr:hypothetical protein B296_00030319 [Ensete ventricosum]